MRFEGKHKGFKNVAKQSPFKNILKTLCHHHQRLMAYNLSSTSFATIKISTGSGEFTVSCNSYLQALIVHVARPITSLLSLPYIDTLKEHHPSVIAKKLFRQEHNSYSIIWPFK